MTSSATTTASPSSFPVLSRSILSVPLYACKTRNGAGENRYARSSPEGNVKASAGDGPDHGIRPFLRVARVGLYYSISALNCARICGWDAEYATKSRFARSRPQACQCGEVLKGVIKPGNVKFWHACTPETPIGTCMVSPEGACAAYYSYGRFSMASERITSRIFTIKKRRRFRRYSGNRSTG